jgi:4-hydroxy-2-oxoglutarate aldolase
MLLEGIHLPLTTPFHPDGRLNWTKLEYNVGRYSLTPAAGLMLLGGSGEGAALTDAESREVLKTVGGAAAKEKVLLAAAGRESVAATLELVEAAAEAEFDAVAVGMPHFIARAGERALRAELRTYFQAVADRSPLRVVLLSGSGETGGQLSLEMMSELAGHPQIIGVIESDTARVRLAMLLGLTDEVSREVVVTNVFAAATRRMRKGAQENGFVSAASLGGVAANVIPMRPALKTRTKKVGFQVLAAGTARMLDALESGAVGAVPRFGACAPQACNEVFQAWKDGDLPLAREKQERIAGIGDRMEGAGAIAGIKYGCDLNGYFGGQPRLPLLGLTAAQRGEIEWQMAGLKN